MSYKYRILADNPLGYWTLGGNINDETSASNTAIWGSPSYTTPPIVASSGSSAYISNSSSVTINNSAGGYEAFAKNCSSNTFTIAFWFDFNNQLNGSGYGTTPYTNNQLHLIHIKSGTTTIGRVYFDYISGTIRFVIFGAGGASNNQEAFYTIKDYENQFYVVATYSNRTLNLNVNGFVGNPGYVADTSYMEQFSKTSISFNVNGNSITGTSGKPSNFIISNIAFFNRSLTPAQIRSHIVWALNDGKPVTNSKVDSTYSYIDIAQPKNNYIYEISLLADSFDKYGNVNNLFVNSNGLNPLKIPSASFSNISGNSTVSTTSASGTTWTNTGAIDIYNISQYFDPSSFILSAQLNRSSVASTNYILSLSEINNNSTLYLESTSSKYNLKLYDSGTGSTYTLLSTSSSPTVGIANVGIMMKSNYVLLYTSDGGTASSLIQNLPVTSLKFSAKTKLTIGNSWHSASTNTFKFSNVGLTNNNISSFSGFDFTSASMFLAKLTSSVSPYVISQYGYWTLDIPAAMYSSIEGSMIDWTSLDNCIVSTSLDRGATWTKVYRDSPIPSYNTLDIPRNISVKVEMNTDYDATSDVSSFNNLRIMLPNNIDFGSYGFYNYQMTHKINSSNSHPTFKNHNYQVLSRPKNLGVRFTSSNPSSASINTSSNTVYAVEMWYRPDQVNTSASNFIINNYGKSAYVYSASNFVYSGGTLYVNGASVTSNSYPVTANNYYHLTFVLSSPSSSTIYINGENLTGSQISSSATYGNINIINSTTSSANIYNRYLSYISPITVAITDSNSTKFISNVSATTASAYKIGNK